MDVREVAKKKHFKDMQEMANYMKSKDYIWSSSAKNYVLVLQEKQVLVENRSPMKIQLREERSEVIALNEVRTFMNSRDESECDCLKKYGDILMMLNDNKEKLLDLLSRNAQGVMHKYRIRGDVKIKSINIVNTLERLVNLFCDEMNITIKEAYETAMIEFLKKYGYGEEVNDLLRG